MLRQDAPGCGAGSFSGGEYCLKYPVAFERGTDYLYGINMAILGRVVDALVSDGTVWRWGYAGDMSIQSTPVRVDALTDVVALAAGSWEDLVLKRDGTVWVWSPHASPPMHPFQVNGLKDIVAIAAGGGDEAFYDYGVAANANGLVWSWGGFLRPLASGVPSTPGALPRLSTIGTAAGGIVALLSDGTLYTTGHGSGDLSGLSDVAASATGFNHLLALKGNGEVWGVGCHSWICLDGNDNYGRVPTLVAGLTGVAAVATNEGYGLAAREDGTVWAWGRNWTGQLGDGTTSDRWFTPVQIPGLSVVRPFPVINVVVNAASYHAGPIAPGELVSVLGSEVGPATGTSNVPNAAGVFKSVLAETRVSFDGIAAPLFFTGARQINAAVPYALAGKTRAEMQVEYRGVKSSPITVDVADSKPGIFSLNFSGSGQGVVLNEDGTLNSSSNPARRRAIVTVFATGEGLTSLPCIDGRIAAMPLPRPLLPVTMQIGGQEASLLEATSAPGMAGVLLVKVKVPEAVAPGPAVPVTLVVGTARSQPSVTLAVQ